MLFFRNAGEALPAPDLALRKRKASGGINRRKQEILAREGRELREWEKGRLPRGRLVACT